MLIQRSTISTVISGWNCVPTLRPIRNACGETAVLAISVAPSGTVNPS
jgi:hypothetical protein